MYSKITLIALVVIFVAVTIGAWHVYQKAEVARTERDISKRALVDIQSRTVELEASLARLKSVRGIEEEVRQKYTVARQGEEIVVVVDEQAKKSENGGTSNSDGFWQRITHILGL